MQDLPSPVDLVAAVADFLRSELMPITSGANGFQLRVAVNVLDLVTRQLRDAPAAEAQEAARLAALLGRDGALDELNRALCEKIADGAMTLDTPGLRDHLWATTLAKLAVDQPTYAAYRREAGRNPLPEGEGGRGATG